MVFWTWRILVLVLALQGEEGCGSGGGLAELGLWVQAGKNWPHHLLQTLIIPHPIHSMAVTSHQSYSEDLA